MNEYTVLAIFVTIAVAFVAKNAFDKYIDKEKTKEIADVAKKAIEALDEKPKRNAENLRDERD